MVGRMPRGICRGCCREVALRLDGVASSHRRRLHGRGVGPCPGAYRPPAGVPEVLKCPVSICTVTVPVSEEDPDTALSELCRHLESAHQCTEVDTRRLLPRARSLPDPTMTGEP